MIWQESQNIKWLLPTTTLNYTTLIHYSIYIGDSKYKYRLWIQTIDTIFLGHSAIIQMYTKSIRQTRVHWLFLVTHRSPPACMCVINFFTRKRPRVSADTRPRALAGHGSRRSRWVHNWKCKCAHLCRLTLKGQAPHVGICIWNLLPWDALPAQTMSSGTLPRARAQRPRRAADPYESSNELLFIIYAHAESSRSGVALLVCQNRRNHLVRPCVQEKLS